MAVRTSRMNGTRREFLAAGAAGVLTLAPIRGERSRARSVILLWMNGGPAADDTFGIDDTAQSCRLFRPIPTRAPGQAFSEGLTQLADLADLLSVATHVRIPEDQHHRAWHRLHTGQAARPTSPAPRRLEPVLERLRRTVPEAFDLRSEPASLRDAYGRSRFGQECLTARRLVEHGVRFVEVELDGWDCHSDARPRTAELLAVLDPAMAALLRDLHQRDLLQTTTVLWMGDFGRTATVNCTGGRDHDPCRSCIVTAGAGATRQPPRRIAPPWAEVCRLP